MSHPEPRLATRVGLGDSFWPTLAARRTGRQGQVSTQTGHDTVTVAADRLLPRAAGQPSATGSHLLAELRTPPHLSCRTRVRPIFDHSGTDPTPPAARYRDCALAPWPGIRCTELARAPGLFDSSRPHPLPPHRCSGGRQGALNPGPRRCERAAGRLMVAVPMISHCGVDERKDVARQVL